ncbi:MAG: hypothetical protein PUP91_19255, partial [Rhizonema sp. PD37]|nr:hypothetical protein [Rhizonema sp. PD37]
MNKLQGLLNWFNRVKITLLTASLVLVLGAIFPWYHLPPQALETFHTNLSFANLGRFLAAMFVILNLAFIFWLSISRARRLILLTGLITVLLFPYFVTTWSPGVAFIASAYYNQGQAVSNHIDTNFSQVQAQWKQNISLNQPSVPPTTFEMSIQNSLFFQMPSWKQIILNGFGYKNSFFEFIGMGWSFSLIGMILSLIGVYLSEQKAEENHLQHSYSLPEVFVVESQGINTFIKDMNLFLPVTLLFLFLILFSIITVN